jgi:hypothetical protein
MKNYLYIWDYKNEHTSFNCYSFVTKMRDIKCNTKQFIKVKSNFINTKYPYIILNGETYQIWSNVIMGNKNIIAIEKCW